jgi:hypothetical protein
MNSFDEIYNCLQEPKGFLKAACLDESQDDFELYQNGKFLTIFHGKFNKHHDVFELSPYWNVKSINYEVKNGVLRVNVIYDFGEKILNGE